MGSGDAKSAAAAAPRILVTFASKHGSTAELAQWIAEALRETGAQADLVPVTADPSPGDYGAVVLGGPMILGWQKAARRFLRRHAGELAGRPTALFITCASLTDTGEEHIDGVPVTKDPWLVTPPRTPEKLSYRERYASPRHYLGDILRKAPDVRPVDAAFFGGALDLTKMNLLEKLLVILLVRATPGDRRHEDAVRAWARAVAAKLSAGGGAAS